MTVRNLATLDREIFQPLGRIIQEAFADGFIGTGSITITKPFTGVSGYNKVMYLTGEISGAGGCAYGMFKFRTYVSAALSADAHTICANLHFKDAAELPAQGHPEYASAPLYATLETEYTAAYPDLSAGNLAALYVGYYINESIGAPAKAYVVTCNDSYPAANMGQWDGLLRVKNYGGIGDATVANGTTQDSASDRLIPILLGDIAYQLRAYKTAQ